MTPLEKSARAWLAGQAERRAAVLRALTAERRRRAERVNPGEWRRVALLQMGTLR